jgi:hypothetical protein
MELAMASQRTQVRLTQDTWAGQRTLQQSQLDISARNPKFNQKDKVAYHTSVSNPCFIKPSSLSSSSQQIGTVRMSQNPAHERTFDLVFPHVYKGRWGDNAGSKIVNHLAQLDTTATERR